jgi:hypothetical protein
MQHFGNCVSVMVMILCLVRGADGGQGEYLRALLYRAKRIREEILQKVKPDAHPRDQLNSPRRLIEELASLTPAAFASAEAVPLPENSIR